jgi:uncharacterized protein YxeA
MKKIVVGILIIIFAIILSFVIPVRKEKKEIWVVKDITSYGHSTNFYYNIYGMKIWPFLDEHAHIRE